MRMRMEKREERCKDPFSSSDSAPDRRRNESERDCEELVCLLRS